MDWCEQKYTHTEFIAEIRNTVSCFTFFMVAIVILQYELIFPVIMSLIGITSFMFHSTTGIYWQLADEMSILLILIYFVYRLKFCNVAVLILLSLILISTIPLFPQISAYLLFLFSSLIVYGVISQKARYTVISYPYKVMSVVCTVVGIVCWIVDRTRLLCIHDWWHIFISLTAYFGYMYVYSANVSDRSLTYSYIIQQKAV